MTAGKKQESVYCVLFWKIYHNVDRKTSMQQAGKISFATFLLLIAMSPHLPLSSHLQHLDDGWKNWVDFLEFRILETSQNTLLRFLTEIIIALVLCCTVQQ